MRYILVLVCCLMLMGCDILPAPTPPQEQTIEQQTAERLSAYQAFLQAMLDQPMSQLMAPHFIDYKELPDAFVVSAALVDIIGDDVPELLVAYSSDVPGAEALTYTQIYHHNGKDIAPLGTKIPLTVQFYGLNQLIGTSQRTGGKQIDRIYQQYQVVPEVLPVARGGFSVIAQPERPEDQTALDRVVSLASTMAIETGPGDLFVMDQPDEQPGFVLFNHQTYPADELSALASQFDLRFVNWQRLSQTFINQLAKYYQNAGRAVLPPAPDKAEIDQIVSQIERDHAAGLTRSRLIGDNTYYYIPELSIRGMEQFRLVKALIDGWEVYLDYHVPIYMHDGEIAYYLGDETKQAVFLSLLQRLRSDMSRNLFRRFLLLDSYAKAVPLANYEFVIEEE